MLSRLVQALRVAFIVVVVGFVIGSSLWTLLAGGPPQERTLVTLTGILGDVRIARGKGLASSTFTVTPAGGAPVDLHMSDFGRPDLAAAVAAAQGQTVTVAYRAAPLGNPVYAMATPAGPVLRYADAAAFERRDGRHTAEGALLIYVALPVLLLATLAVIRRRARVRGQQIAGRSRPAVVLPARVTAAEIDPTRVAAGVGTVVPLLLFGFLALLLGREMATDPAMMKPFVGVLGPAPLGIPARYAAPVLLMAGIAPLFVAMSHGMAVLARLAQVDGRMPVGMVSILLAMRRNRDLLADDAAIRRHVRWTLAALALFLALCAAWIWATARAGV